MPVDDGYQGSGGRNGSDTNVPVPDPSLLTTQQLREGLSDLEKLIGVRLDAIDEATNLRLAAFAHVPDQIKERVGELRDLHNEKFRSQSVQVEERFSSVALQFEERDKRGERESRDNKVAVDAAFAAQKEAASEQNKSNTLAISKSEASTAETINKLEQLVSANIQGLNDKVDDIKATAATLRQEVTSSINQIRSELIAYKSGAESALLSRRDTLLDNREQRNEGRLGAQVLIGIAGLLLLIVSILIAGYVAAHRR